MRDVHILVRSMDINQHLVRGLHGKPPSDGMHGGSVDLVFGVRVPFGVSVHLADPKMDALI